MSDDLLKERFKKYESLKSLGIDPFGGKFLKDFFIGPLKEHFEENKKVRTAGRLTAVRSIPSAASS
jgi:lysyl-tRNA synthetase class 2